ncbi:larval cuticle protein 1-like isoform X1 [Pectinophora gossypiella]|uniref:larval cuticle protein 1-like isoform X1 n=1 Tax=Pectinophora gossypiella TaxID=13191 RepID=UPI00214E5177|nr:larval cuticle protein 1-like isoform X1 [Pectinophora gossypiella]
MYFLQLLVAFALVAVACAAPPASDVEAKIVRSEFEQQPEGSYVYSFETDNGINRQENGEVKEALDEENKPHNVVVVRGSYSYTDPEGNPQTITYVADETGFHAEGDSIPKEPVSRR